MRNAYAHLACDPACCGRDEAEDCQCEVRAMTQAVSRRGVLAGAGALIVAFGLSRAHAQTETGTGGGPSKHGLPGSLEDTPNIDAWIRVDASGAVTILTGKAELGQGLKTALLQVAAEELKVPLVRLSLVTADTARAANEGYTAASHSMQDSGTARYSALTACAWATANWFAINCCQLKRSRHRA